MINFEDGILIEDAYVEIDGVKYPVHMPKYSGNTPITSENLNKIQHDIIQNDIPTKITVGEEVVTNEYVDGKQVYVKRIECGALPNNTTKNISHGLNMNNIKVIKFNGIATNGSNIFSLPHIDVNGNQYFISLYLNQSNIVIGTEMDRSTYTESYVDIYYTKNN